MYVFTTKERKEYFFKSFEKIRNDISTFMDEIKQKTEVSKQHLSPVRLLLFSNEVYFRQQSIQFLFASYRNLVIDLIAEFAKNRAQIDKKLMEELQSIAENLQRSDFGIENVCFSITTIISNVSHAATLDSSGSVNEVRAKMLSGHVLTRT